MDRLHDLPTIFKNLIILSILCITAKYGHVKKQKQKNNSLDIGRENRATCNN